MTGSLVRAVDLALSPGVEKDMGDGDEWPGVRRRILDADILVFNTLYELFSITADPAHKRAAEYFDEVTLFQQLAAGCPHELIPHALKRIDSRGAGGLAAKQRLGSGARL